MTHHFIVSTALPQKKIASHRFTQHTLHLKQVTGLEDFALMISNQMLHTVNACVGDVEA